MSFILNGIRNANAVRLSAQLSRNSVTLRLPNIAACRQQLAFSSDATNTTKDDDSAPENFAAAPSKLSGFAQAFERHSQPAPEPPAEPAKSFATLLRQSKFVDLGDSENKIVTGKIFHIVDDDLYIDFGWKFHCVCTRPVKNGSEYVRGAKVRLRIKDLELSTRFLGSEKDLTILEADCQIVSLVSSPARGSSYRSRQSQQIGV